MRQHVLVTYDISDPDRLRRVARICEDFGDRVQLSVFACQLGRKDLAVLRERLRDVISHKDDQVLFFALGPVADDHSDRVEVEWLGRAMVALDVRALVF